MDSRADNAQPPTRQPCNIKPLSVSPTRNAAGDEQVMSAHPTQREGQGAGEEVEFSNKDVSPVLHHSHSLPHPSYRGETGKHVQIMEENNEVVEIPSRGRDKRVRQRDRGSAGKLCDPNGVRDSTPRQLHAVDDRVTDRMSEEEYQRAVAPWGGAQVAAEAVEGFGEEIEDAPDELDLPEVSPEEVTDDEVFSERDFEAIEKAFPADDDPFWEVEDQFLLATHHNFLGIRRKGLQLNIQFSRHRFQHTVLCWTLLLLGSFLFQQY